MPIHIRRPGTTHSMTAHPVAEQRLGSVEEASMPITTPEVLLPVGSFPAPAPVPAPARALALEALRISRVLRDPAARPARWAQPSFGAQVELVRRHLAPVRSRTALAASFGREAFHIVPTAIDPDDPGPIRLAYALRWLELRDGATGPSWSTLVD
jgi:hypothetical protein